jgi:Tol biopolymer transport system component
MEMIDFSRGAFWGIALTMMLSLLLCGEGAKAAAPGGNRQFLNCEFAVSPDGTKLGYPVLGYDQTGDPVSELWVSQLDGSSPKRVGGLAGYWNVHWWDAEHLAAMQFDNNRIHLIPLGGGKETILSLTDDFDWAQPAISPNHDWVAFSAVRLAPRESGIFALDVKSGKVKELSKEVVKSFVDFSPDSGKIVYGVGAYQKTYRIKLADVRDGAITDTALEGVGARWSPDGKWIAYTGNIVRGGSWYSGVPADGSIIKANLETKATMALTEPAMNKLDEQAGTLELSGAINPTWSPDGGKIAYRRLHKIVDTKTYRESLSEDQLWIMKADGSDKKKVGEEYLPYAWGKDGRSIFLKGEKGITRVELDSGKSRPVVAWDIPEPPEAKASDWNSIRTPGAAVKYLWITPEYAKAILILTATARDIYANVLHCDMPPTVQVTVTKNYSAATSLWTDGDSQVFLTITSMDKLAPPSQSGVFNLYGFCHELGHLALYRRIKPIGLPDGVAEGWAHYAGSVVTDEVYKRQGEKLWPIPYDYRADGRKRLEAQTANPEALEDPTLKAAAAFYQADRRYGTAKVFAAMNEATEGGGYGKEVMPKFVEALAKITGDPTSRALFPEALVTSKVAWQVADRKIDDKAVEGLRATPDNAGLLLQYDDGKSDGMLSTAGSGHAVVFRRPEGKWAVDYVEMYGSRYGEPEAPKEDFTIFLCDQDFNVIKEVAEPYSKLAYGDEPKWQRFDFSPVAVPEGFYICVCFNPTATKGFYMHYSTHGKKSHSKNALPWSFVNDTPNDWMIRTHIRKSEQ